MSMQAVGLILDVLVLGFLGVMIFYAVRLSSSLREFRTQRGEFDAVIADLLSSIDQAERSLHGLKQVSANESAELNDLIRKAKLLSEELRDVNQASEGMASRLEALAEKNRKIVQEMSDPRFAVAPQEAPVKGSMAAMQGIKPVTKSDLPSFMIQDRDFEDLDALGQRLESGVSNDKEMSEDLADTDQDMPPQLQSKAERELYEALRAGKHAANIRRGG